MRRSGVPWRADIGILLVAERQHFACLDDTRPHRLSEVGVDGIELDAEKTGHAPFDILLEWSQLVRPQDLDGRPPYPRNRADQRLVLERTASIRATSLRPVILDNALKGGELVLWHEDGGQGDTRLGPFIDQVTTLRTTRKTLDGQIDIRVKGKLHLDAEAALQSGIPLCRLWTSTT